jgi:hypothetical protein
VPAASASTAYVDGISDQNMPQWDHSFASSWFASYFKSVWVERGHIKLARYVVQWNVMSGSYTAERELFENWLNDTASMGLTPEVALTSYDGTYPTTSTEYDERLVQILNQAKTMGHAIRYVEAWNEPNNQGKLDEGGRTAITAAHFTNSASATCETDGCTVVAGDLEDGNSKSTPADIEYETKYYENLSPKPTTWGFHPYYAIQEKTTAHLKELINALPNKSSDQIWITEAAARKCSDFGGHFEENGESGQAARAEWLVKTLIPEIKPEHVFWYEFLYKNRESPSSPCEKGGEDDALYYPSGSSEDAPRPAASYIFDNSSEWHLEQGPSSDPAGSAFATPGGAFETFSRDTDGAIDNYYLPEKGSWELTQIPKLGAEPVGQPTAIDVSGSFQVFARDAKGGIDNYYLPEKGTWQLTQIPKLGGEPVGNATAFATKGGALEVFSRDANGGIDNYYLPENGTWHLTIIPSSSGSPIGTPTAFATKGGAFEVFVRDANGGIDNYYLPENNSWQFTLIPESSGDPTGSPSAFVTPGGAFEVFARDQNGGIDNYYLPEKSTWQFTLIPRSGASPAGSPAAFGAPGAFDVFDRDANGALDNYYLPEKSTWQLTQIPKLGGDIADPEPASPGASFQSNSGAFETFAHDANGAIDDYQLPVGGSWQLSQIPKLGAEPIGTPVALQRQTGSLQVFAPDKNGAIDDYSLGSEWQLTQIPKLGGAPVGSPTAFQTPTGALEVFATDGNGGIDNYYLPVGGSWQLTVIPKSSGAPTGNPAAFVTEGGTIDVFALDANGAIDNYYLPVGGSWQFTLIAKSSGDPTGSPTAFATEDGAFEVFVRDANGGIDNYYLPERGTWQVSVIPKSSGDPTGSPTAFATEDGAFEVFVRDANGGIDNYYLPEKGTWQVSVIPKSSGAPEGNVSAFVTPGGAYETFAVDANGGIDNYYLPEGGSWQWTQIAKLGGEPIFTEPPGDVAPPTISPSTPDENVPVAATPGSWTNGPTSYTYQWKRCNGSGTECVAISGGTTSTYTPTEADDEHTLRVMVTAANAGGLSVAVSNATSAVKRAFGITEVPVSKTGEPQGIVAGPGGEEDMWFTEPGADKIGFSCTRCR